MKLGSTKKKDTVRVSVKDLTRLLTEHESQAKEITDLQSRINDLLGEIYHLKTGPTAEDLEEGAPDDWGPGPGRSPTTPLPEDYRNHPEPELAPLDNYGPDVYIDGASRYRNDLDE